MRNLIGTPANISDAIRDMVKSLNIHAIPTFILITPEPGAEPNECFKNVHEKVAKEGGKICFGWSIWEWPRVFIEAEHHAVYEPVSGPPWVDITPPTNPETARRFFLPDNGATYDFRNEGSRRDNIRFALSDDPDIQAFFRAAELRTQLFNTISGVGYVKLPPEMARNIVAAEAELANLQTKLALKYLGQNERCFCGSEKKFKRCHGHPLLTNLRHHEAPPS